MKRFLRIFALVVLGFALGGGAAYLTALHKYRSLQGQAHPAAQKSARGKTGTDVEITQSADGRLHAHHGKSKAGDAIVTEKDPHKSLMDQAAATPDKAAKDKPASTGADSITAPGTDDTALAPAAPPPPRIDPRHLSPAIGLYVPGNFTLADTDGREVTEKSWPDKYQLVFFGYTHSPDIVPVTLQKLTAALDKLGPLAAKVQPLFITIDPDRDDGDMLKDYLAHYHKSFLGLTGTPDQLQAAEEAFKVYVRRIPGRDDAEYDFDHSALVYLMSPDHLLVTTFKVTDTTAVTTDKLRAVLDGTMNAKGFPR